MKRILVAGAAGFTGFAVCELLGSKYQVRGIDLKPMPHLQDAVQADLAEFDTVLRAMEGVDGVINCLMAPNEVYEKPELPMKWNVLGLANLLEAARQKGVARFVHTSTTGIFSVDRPAFIDASSRAVPKGWYPVTKWLQELLCENFSQAHGMSIAVMRVAGGIVCGRTQKLKSGAALSKKDFHVGWICRYDIAEACRLALEAPELCFESFIIGSTPELMEKFDIRHLMDRLGWRPKYDFHEYR